MSLSNKFISCLIEQMRPRILNCHINKIIGLNDTDFLMSKSKNCQEKIFISLNNRSPFITICQEVKQFTSISNNFLVKFKKEIENGRIIDIKKLPNDRIVEIIISKTSETYKKNTRYIYLELIPNQTNLILTDEENKILLCLRNVSLESGRLILPNAIYTLPLTQKQSEYSKFEEEQIEKYHTQDLGLNKDENNYSVITTPTSRVISLNDLYLDYANAMEDKHRKETNSEVVLAINRHFKSLKKKFEHLNTELKNAQNFEQYLTYGNLILTYQQNNLHQSGLTNLDFDGIKVELNPLKTLKENANDYFNKYHKTKRSVSFIQEQITLTQDKISYFETLKNQLECSNDADLKGIEFELCEKGYIFKKTLKKQNSKSQGMSQPYYIEIEGTKIGFGKNNIQNNYLTFSLAKPNHYFLHVLNKPGTHVIIFSENPSKKVQECAAMIALINSNLEDGEVQITPKKYVKKINSFGLVSLDKYSTIYIRNIDDNLKKLVQITRKN